MAQPAVASNGAVATGTTGASSAASVAVPTGVVAGSLVVIAVYAVSATSVTATGFTAGVSVTAPGPDQIHFLYKYATGADSGTYAVSSPGSTFTRAQAYRVTNGPTSGNPFVDGIHYAAATATSTTITGWTPTGGENLHLLMASNNGSPARTYTLNTNPAAWTEITDSGGVLTARTAQAGSGATGNVVMTMSGSAFNSGAIATIRGVTVAATLAASMPLLTGSLTGTQSAAPGTLDAAVPVLTAAATGAVGVTGSLAAPTPKTTAALADTPDPFARWRAAILAAVAGTSTAKVLIIGDSWMGHAGTTTRAGMWPIRLLNKVRTRYALDGAGSTGFIPPRYSDWSPIPNPSTGTGTYDQNTQGQGDNAVALASGQFVEWASLAMSSFDVVYTGSTGDLTVTVDGSTVGTIDANATTLAGRIAHFDVADGTHTVRVTATGGAGVVEGIVVYNGDETGGITWWDCTHVGWASNGYGAEQRQGWENYAPDLVVWGMYGNNWLGGGTRSPSQAAADFLADVADLPGNPTVVVFHAPQMPGFPFNTPANGNTVQDYIDALNDAADSIGGTNLNLQTYYGVDWEASGWLDTDDAHPNATGHQKVADALDAMLAAGADIEVVSGTLTATLPRATSSTTGALTVTGTIAGTLPDPTAATSGQVRYAATQASALPPLAGSATGSVAVPGTLTATTPVLAGSLPGAGVVTGALSATTPKVTGSAVAAVSVTGTLSSVVPVPRGSLAGSVADVSGGSLAATVPSLAATLAGAVRVTGTLTCVLPTVHAALPGGAPPWREVEVTVTEPEGHPLLVGVPEGHPFHITPPRSET